MKKTFAGLTALGFMVTALLLVAVPTGAQSVVDDKIKALEQELTDLKSQQIELKKESTAAAAGLPTFNYRPGNGVDISAADKSWASASRWMLTSAHCLRAGKTRLAGPTVR